MNKKSIKEIYAEYIRLKNQGKFDADITKELGITKETLKKVINFYQEKKYVD